LVGAIGERTVALAGESSDGVIFTEQTTPEMLRAALPHFTAGAASATRTDDQDVVVFMPVEGNPAAADVADRIGQLVMVGATHVILLSVGAAPALQDFVRFVAGDVRPLVR
jgi:alkanesulfonate monooxygenase SsuD/methylene tetrahydromethanopterin reductase-like flavin-dependent oxidoreductase (luciferase family)